MHREPGTTLARNWRAATLLVACAFPACQVGDLDNPSLDHPIANPYSADTVDEVSANNLQRADAIADIDAVAANLNSAIEHWTHEATKFLNTKTRNGIFLTSSQVPATGRLLIKYDDGSITANSSCSGTLISDQYYLTAAHCICGQLNTPWFYRDFEECRSNLSRFRFHVFFPTLGIFSVQDEPIINESYYSPENPIEPDKTIVADLALVRLDRKVPLPIPLLDTANASERPLMSSFGMLSLASLPKSFGLAAGITYQEGIQQISKQRLIYLDPGACGDYGTLDTFCTEYSSVPVKAGPGVDAGACGGDSGGPLYRPEQINGRFRLIGITSYYSPANFDCQSGRLTHFVNISRYAGWIASETSVADAIDVTGPTCVDAILKGPGLFPIHVRPGLVSITTFDERSGDASRPDLSLVGISSDRCDLATEFGVAACSIAEPLLLQIILRSGFAQITICQSAMSNTNAGGGK